MMKFLRLTSQTVAAVAMASLFLSSCSDEKKETKVTEAQQNAADTPAEQPAPVPPAADVLQALLPESLSASPWLKVQNMQVSSSSREGAEERADFDVSLLLNQDLCEPAETPSQLDELRLKVNPALNRAMTPESQYLLQVGAAPSTITEEDKKATPLPAELQQLADALQHLAEPAVYKVSVHEGETLVLRGSARRAAAASGTEPSAWELASLDETPLDAWKKLTPRESLPEGASVLSAAWLSEQTQKLESAMADFEKAAAPYIESREEAARTRLLEAQAREDADKAKGAAAAEALRQERARFEQACAAGRVWQGEWSLDEQGGKLMMTIVTSESGERSAMLTANLTDPDLPQASVDMKGRCLLLPEEGEEYRFQIAIIDGLYDPDAATAKIYDASDGVLLLNLTEDGFLEGVLTCKSWTEEQKGQIIKVVLKPSTKSKNKGGSR